METPGIQQSGAVIHPCVIELRDMLRSVLGDDFVRLYHYGSRVEGQSSANSDYDVLCVTRRPLSRHEMDVVMDRRIEIQLAHDILFDLHFFLDDEIGAPPIGCLLFLENAVGQGIVV
jgi:hypothetical protein